MTKTHTLVTYVKGPIEERPGRIKKVLGAEDADVYLVNPQLYRNTGSDPLENWEVERHAYESGKAPSKEAFKEFIEKNIEERLGVQVDLEDGDSVPFSRISIEVEFTDIWLIENIASFLGRERNLTCL